MSGLREGEILVVSFELMRGIEHPFIIDTTITRDISSRTSAKLVKIYANWFLDMTAVAEQLLKDDQHQCQEMMERDSRPQIDLSISSLIGGFFYFCFANYLKIQFFFLCFSDNKLALKNLSRSQSLPYPQVYKTVGTNPILSCILDQMKPDQELLNKYPNQKAMLDETIAALETGRIHWPSTSSFNLMSAEQWIQKMSVNPIFYFHHAKNDSEMQEYEDLLLDLVAQCLKRKIQVIPFLWQDEGHFPTIFPRTLFSKLKSVFVNVRPDFYLLSIQKLKQQNFFISISRKDCQNDEQVMSTYDGLLAIYKSKIRKN